MQDRIRSQEIIDGLQSRVTEMIQRHLGWMAGSHQCMAESQQRIAENLHEIAGNQRVISENLRRFQEGEEKRDTLMGQLTQAVAAASGRRCAD